MIEFLCVVGAITIALCLVGADGLVDGEEDL